MLPLSHILTKSVSPVPCNARRLPEIIAFLIVTGESARDILGQVYEYFLGQFASAEGKRGGQFYSPASIVRTLVAILAPHHGQVYDPCCGSGGMFVQSEKLIEAHGGRNGDVIRPWPRRTRRGIPPRSSNSYSWHCRIL